MGKIFISYRRRESADFCGRLFDRLSGYFGSERVYMDVDDLIAGKDYREQINEIIAECDVVLAVIGEQWVSIEDESGVRRLDKEDDQLRIEIESGLAQNKTVIPVLIHDTSQPAPEVLPASIQQIATLPFVEVKSGLPFTADFRKLLDRIENSGVKHPDNRFPLEMILIPLGILCSLVGTLGITSVPLLANYVEAELTSAQTSAYFGGPPQQRELTPYFDAMRSWLLWGILPIFLGPILIVAGKRWCCLTKKVTSSRVHFRSGGGRLKAPKNSKSVYSLASGLTAPAIGALSIIPAFIFGIWAFFELRKRGNWVQGRALAVTGMFLALLGLVVTEFVHLPVLRDAIWFRDLQNAQEMEDAGDFTQAAELYDSMSRMSSDDNVREWAALLFEAQNRIELEQTDEARTLLTEVINHSDELSGAFGTEFYIIQEALETRALLSESEGDMESAYADRAAIGELGQQATEAPEEFDGGYGEENSGNSGLPPAPAFDSGSAPTPPAPVVDPSA